MRCPELFLITMNIRIPTLPVSPSRPLYSVVLALLSVSHLAGAADLVVTVVNELPAARSRQTIALSLDQLSELGERDLRKIHVMDESGTPLLCQAVDADGDVFQRPDQIVFQADFGAVQTRQFTLKSGPVQQYAPKDFRAFGRFVRERFDDFAWENDLVAFRTYGKALETWEGEPLASSTIDIWSKRTHRMVINEWYMAGDYHEDHGEGADFYSAGLSRGCGGSGLWADDTLWTSRNFVASRVLANGPIRVIFELDYEPFAVNGISVAETKRVTLDAGSYFNHIESVYHPYTRGGRPVALVGAIGLKKVSGEEVVSNPENGSLRKWEPVQKKAGNQGLAVVLARGAWQGTAETDMDHLVLVPLEEDHVLEYWAGFCWDRAGAIENADAWAAYIKRFSDGLASPLSMHIAPQ